MSYTPDFKPFSSGCGVCKPSNDYYKIQTGGVGNYCKDGLESNGKIPTLLKSNYYYETANGGSNKTKSKNSKKVKGGFFDIKNLLNIGKTQTQYPTPEEESMSGGKKSKKTKKSVQSKSKSTCKKPVKRSKKMKGGMESSGAISMDSRFYNPNSKLDNYSELSGNGVMTSYGPNESGDVGTGMLAPYILSNHSSGMKTGGAKKSKQKSENKKKDKKTIKSKKPVKKSKKMKGGMESSGATSMDSRFYNPNGKLNDYSELSGNGMMSAYGPIESGNVGSGMLAPYTASKSETVNPSTSMKTGGAKKKNLKGGKDLIPTVSDGSVVSTRNTLNGVINNFVNFMSKLDANYNKSVQQISSVQFGNQRLIQQGGKKLKVSKKSPKKQSKKLKVKKGGSNGSDFALTLNSRGPVNAPDDYWGVPGEQWFRQFNKTGDYIPNSKLAYAATPLLASKNDCGVVSGYDESTMAYPSV